MEDRRRSIRSVDVKRAAAICACLLLGHAVLVVALRDDQARADVTNVLKSLEGLAITGALLCGGRRMVRSSPSVGRAWLVLAAAQLAYTLGDATWAVIEVGRGRVPLPSSADALYLLVYPLYLAGLWLPPNPPQTARQRWRSLIDVSMVMCTALLGCWTFLVRPTVVVTAASLPALAVSLAYPVGDLMLLWAVSTKLFNRQEHGALGPLQMLLGSAVVMAITDCLFDYQSLRGTYVSGGFLDLGWLASTLPLGLAGMTYLYVLEAAPEARPVADAADLTQARLAFWPRLLPYISTFLAYSFLVLSGHLRLGMTQVAIEVIVAVLLCLVLLRQGLEARENSALSEQLRRANDELEWRVELRTADLVAANRTLAVEIAERRQAEAALRDSEEHFRALAESASDAIISTNDRGRITYWNPGAEAMFGYTPYEVAGVPAQSPVHGDLASLDELAMAEAIGTMPPGYRSTIFEVEGRHKNGGTFPAEVSFAIWSARQGVHLTAIVRNVSERLRMEQQLSQARKLESIGQLAAGIAHELNTPAQYVSSNLRFLRDRLGALLSTARQVQEMGEGDGGTERALAIGRRLEHQLGQGQLDYLLQEVPLAIDQSLEGMGRVNSIVSAMRDFSHPGSSAKVATDINRSVTSTLTVARNEYKHVADAVTDRAPTCRPCPATPPSWARCSSTSSSTPLRPST